MKLLQLILSILTGICTVGMFYGAFTSNSQMKMASIIVTSLLVMGSGALAWFSYKEFKKR